jgi:plasmid maintenance system killer protein
MNYQFQSSELEDLYFEGKGISRYPDSVIRAFFKKIINIKNAKHEGDLREIKGNHFEKLKGFENRYSIRLNDKYRLIFSIQESSEKMIVVEEISNHYE